jgi:hypothetical protein
LSRVLKARSRAKAVEYMKANEGKTPHNGANKMIVADYMYY